MLPISYIIPPWFDPQIHPRQFCRCRWTYTEDLGRFLLAASRLVANAVLRCCENLGVTVVYLARWREGSQVTRPDDRGGARDRPRNGPLPLSGRARWPPTSPRTSCRRLPT